jgi:hypothetical protein
MAAKLHHLTPLLSFFSDKLAEVGGRAWKWDSGRESGHGNTDVNDPYRKNWDMYSLCSMKRAKRWRCGDQAIALDNS